MLRYICNSVVTLNREEMTTNMEVKVTFSHITWCSLYNLNADITEVTERERETEREIERERVDIESEY